MLPWLVQAQRDVPRVRRERRACRCGGHRAAALLALLHFFWMRAAKQNFAEWSVYAVVIGALLGWRLWRWVRSRRASAHIKATIRR
jgi:hypothetical protein